MVIYDYILRRFCFIFKICNVGDDGQKECSLATIANLVQEKEAILKLLKKGIVKKLGPLLADANLQIKEKVAGTFRFLWICFTFSYSEIFDRDFVDTKRDFQRGALRKIFCFAVKS